MPRRSLGWVRVSPGSHEKGVHSTVHLRCTVLSRKHPERRGLSTLKRSYRIDAARREHQSTLQLGHYRARIRHLASDFLPPLPVEHETGGEQSCRCPGARLRGDQTFNFNSCCQGVTIVPARRQRDWFEIVTPLKSILLEWTPHTGRSTSTSSRFTNKAFSTRRACSTRAAPHRVH